MSACCCLKQPVQTYGLGIRPSSNRTSLIVVISGDGHSLLLPVNRVGSFPNNYVCTVCFNNIQFEVVRILLPLTILTKIMFLFTKYFLKHIAPVKVICSLSIKPIAFGSQFLHNPLSRHKDLQSLCPY